MPTSALAPEPRPDGAGVAVIAEMTKQVMVAAPVGADPEFKEVPVGLWKIYPFAYTAYMVVGADIVEVVVVKSPFGSGRMKVAMPAGFME
jgi:hypothetical protein